MKQGNNSRRSRGRGNGKRQQRNNNVDSHGPEVRVRGTVQQVHDKYLTLARDATSSGDRISAENYYQHAEHYHRIIAAQQENAEQKQDNRDSGRDNLRNRKDQDNNANPEKNADSSTSGEKEKQVTGSSEAIDQKEGQSSDATVGDTEIGLPEKESQVDSVVTETDTETEQSIEQATA